jgi:hypothetical protein
MFDVEVHGKRSRRFDWREETSYSSFPFFLLTVRCLTSNSSALVELELSHPLCLTTFAESKDMGRFLLRSHGESIAVGMIIEVGHDVLSRTRRFLVDRSSPLYAYMQNVYVVCLRRLSYSKLIPFAFRWLSSSCSLTNESAFLWPIGRQGSQASLLRVPSFVQGVHLVYRR